MKILIFNQDWFAQEFREAGHEVITAGLSPSFDVMIPRPVVHIHSVITLLPNGFQPDVILWLDNSAPPLLTGLEENPIPIVFYSVDTHHHVDLHSTLAPIFDHILIAQKDYIPQFARSNTPMTWLPLWASRFVEASENKRYGATFVGNRNVKLNPGRVAFFNTLEKKVPIHLDQGEYWKIFPHSEIVVNQTVKRDLNFRVFEAMMCGAMLLTENSANGLTEIFQDGVHLALYEKDDTDDAAAKINMYLEDLPRTREIARAGREEILRAHLPIHRAQVVLKILSSVTRRRFDPQTYFASMINFGAVSTMIEYTDTTASAHAIVASLAAAEQALRQGATPFELESAHIVINSIRYDRIMKSQSGHNLIKQFAEAYPDNRLFALAKIRGYLNLGEIAEASNAARSFSSDTPQEIFAAAENAVTTLLSISDGTVS
jgi:hypothetical protein